MMKNYLLTVGLLGVLGGCASAGDLQQRGPIATSSSSLSPVAAANCLVAELDRRQRDTTGLGKSISHRVDTIVIGERFRVTPADTITVAAQSYMVDVTAAAGGAKLSGYAGAGWSSLINTVVTACAG
jgi:hypothetical protein